MDVKNKSLMRPNRGRKEGLPLFSLFLGLSRPSVVLSLHWPDPRQPNLQEVRCAQGLGTVIHTMSIITISVLNAICSEP